MSTDIVEIEIEAGRVLRKSGGWKAVEEPGAFQIFSSQEDGRHFCWRNSMTNEVVLDTVFQPNEFVCRAAPDVDGYRSFMVENKTTQHRCYFYLQEASYDCNVVCQTLNSFLCDPELQSAEDCPNTGMNQSTSDLSTPMATNELITSGNSNVPNSSQTPDKDNTLSRSQATVGQSVVDDSIPPNYHFLFQDNKLMEDEIKAAGEIECSARNLKKEVGAKNAVRKSLKKLNDGQLMLLLRNQTRKSTKATAEATTTLPAQYVQSSQFRQSHEEFLRDVEQKCDVVVLVPFLANPDVKVFLNMMLPNDQQMPATEEELLELKGSPFLKEVMRLFITSFSSGQMKHLCMKMGLKEKEVEAAAAGDIVAFLDLLKSNTMEVAQQNELPSTT